MTRVRCGLSDTRLLNVLPDLCEYSESQADARAGGGAKQFRGETMSQLGAHSARIAEMFSSVCQVELFRKARDRGVTRALL